MQSKPVDRSAPDIVTRQNRSRRPKADDAGPFAMVLQQSLAAGVPARPTLTQSDHSADAADPLAARSTSCSPIATGSRPEPISVSGFSASNGGANGESEGVTGSLEAATAAELGRVCTANAASAACAAGNTDAASAADAAGTADATGAASAVGADMAGIAVAAGQVRLDADSTVARSEAAEMASIVAKPASSVTQMAERAAEPLPADGSMTGDAADRLEPSFTAFTTDGSRKGSDGPTGTPPAPVAPPRSLPAAAVPATSTVDPAFADATAGERIPGGSSAMADDHPAGAGASRANRSQDTGEPAHSAGIAGSLHPSMSASSLDAASEAVDASSASASGPDAPLDVSQQVAAWDLHAGDAGQTLTVRLKPNRLGTMSIRIEQTDAGLSARIQTESLAACQLLESQRAQLAEALEARGLDCRQIEIAWRVANGSEQKSSADHLPGEPIAREAAREQEWSPDQEPALGQGQTSGQGEPAGQWQTRPDRKDTGQPWRNGTTKPGASGASLQESAPLAARRLVTSRLDRLA